MTTCEVVKTGDIVKVKVLEVDLAALQALRDEGSATLPSAGAFTYRRRENLYLWQGQMPSRMQAYRIWFEPYDLHPVRFEMEDAGGQLVLQVWYEEFQRFNGFMMPPLRFISCLI